MTKHTIVVDFDRDEPGYHAGMQILGGTLVAVQFSDALAELDDLKDLIAAVASSPDVMFTIDGNDPELAERVTDATGMQP